jgi:MtN3 and saliva related transmembrane protein
MTMNDIVAAAAAIASTASFAPQALKIIRTRKTKDISLWMYVLTVSAFALWTAFGVLTSQWPLLASNVICLVLSGFILMMKLLPDRKRPV